MLDQKVPKKECNARVGAQDQERFMDHFANCVFVWGFELPESWAGSSVPRCLSIGPANRGPEKTRSLWKACNRPLPLGGAAHEIAELTCWRRIRHSTSLALTRTGVKCPPPAKVSSFAVLDASHTRRLYPPEGSLGTATICL